MPLRTVGSAHVANYTPSSCTPTLDHSTKPLPLPLPRAAAVDATTHGWILVGLMLVFVAFFAIGSGPVTWVLLSEVLPPSIKGPAASLATAAGWAGGFKG